MEKAKIFRMMDPLGDLALSMGKAHEFVECNFRIGTEEGENIMSPPRKRVLATWQTYYHTTINGTGQIVNRLLPLIQQCKAINADSLKSSKIHIARQMSSLKMEFDSSFEGSWTS